MASNLKDIYVGVNKKDEKRRDNDFYPTPPLATYILHKYYDLPKNIVEPCAGRGNISVELERCGYNVKSFDLNEYDDLLTSVTTNQDVMFLPKQEGYTCAVTNPPYHKDLPRKIAEKLVSEYDVVAMFLRLTFLEGKKRKKLFTTNNISDIIFLSDRIKFEKNIIEPVEKHEQIGGMISYAWFIWDRRNKNSNTNLRWVLLDQEYDEWRKHYESSKGKFKNE